MIDGCDENITYNASPVIYTGRPPPRDYNQSKERRKLIDLLTILTEIDGLPTVISILMEEEQGDFLFHVACNTTTLLHNSTMWYDTMHTNSLYDMLRYTG